MPLLKMKEDICENGKFGEIYRVSHEKLHFRVLNNIDALHPNFEPTRRPSAMRHFIHVAVSFNI